MVTIYIPKYNHRMIFNIFLYEENVCFLLISDLDSKNLTKNRVETRTSCIQSKNILVHTIIIIISNQWQIFINQKNNFHRVSQNPGLRTSLKWEF